MVSNNDKLILLVTGAGAPGIWGTLHALRNNPDGRPVRVIGVDTKPDVAGAAMVDVFYCVPPPESPDYLAAIVEISRREDVRVILPQTTREVAALSIAAPVIEQHGFRVMVSAAQAVAAANDKAGVMEAFRRLGLPTAASMLARSEAELVSAAHTL